MASLSLQHDYSEAFSNISKYNGRFSYGAGTSEASVKTMPFFIPVRSECLPDLNIVSQEVVNACTDLRNKYNLPLEWLVIYSVMDSLDRELTLSTSRNDISFLSLSYILKQGEQSPKFIDLCLLHVGMGHVMLLSWDPSTKQTFFRRDGGSSGIDREYNFKRYSSSSFNPSDESYTPNRIGFIEGIDKLILCANGESCAVQSI